MTADDPSTGHPARQAMAALERALAARPAKDSKAFSETTQCLCAWRDEIIRRTGGADTSHAESERLTRVNGVLSAVLGGHFPLGPVPWHEVELARDWLRQLVDEWERETA